ncbi:MAG: hypothetical protein AVDCRST_MAG25-111 [uncultured Rubrobacteraceae bacterium]|uniref:Uncharacterized protein n=1 Tax=uncultured Rubrobacteraceae bacterium TaxID=349277 RepID=A0A6J4QV50_9ACTN|nr:MAG: hypothetical protein AVDCRST_MAG25-111 [uncultured Rubrobacteraceae bacterium]
MAHTMVSAARFEGFFAFHAFPNHPHRSIGTLSVGK